MKKIILGALALSVLVSTVFAETGTRADMQKLMGEKVRKISATSSEDFSLAFTFYINKSIQSSRIDFRKAKKDGYSSVLFSTNPFVLASKFQGKTEDMKIKIKSWIKNHSKYSERFNALSLTYSTNSQTLQCILNTTQKSDGYADDDIVNLRCTDLSFKPYGNKAEVGE